MFAGKSAKSLHVSAPEGIIVMATKSGWNTAEVYGDTILPQVLHKYKSECVVVLCFHPPFPADSRFILTQDHAPCHVSDAAKEKVLKSFPLMHSPLVPPGQTGNLQPLDAVTNKTVRSATEAKQVELLAEV